jgi:tryptophan synthase alpha subunit
MSASSTTATPTTPPVGTSREGGGFFSKFINTIKREINDLSYVEIITAAGEPKTEINPDADDIIAALKALNQINILARTRLELDGDIAVILPTDKDGVKINTEVMAIHKQNVDTAVTNWNNFVHNILAALELLISISGLPKSDVLAHFNSISPPP